jgi:outer membrane protein assembly factor BamB
MRDFMVARRSLLLILVVGFACSGFVFAADWPQYRGPGGQGIAENADPPLHWSLEKNIAWKTDIAGEGWSSPVVYQGSVYLTTAALDEKKNPISLRVVRVDAKTGQIVWEQMHLILLVVGIHSRYSLMLPQVF